MRPSSGVGDRRAQPGQDAGFGAPEAVDRLLGVADGRQRRVGGAQRGQQRGLDRVDVLRLVEEQGAPAGVQVGADVGVLQRARRVRLEVRERERLGAALAGVDGRERPVEGGAHVGDARRGEVVERPPVQRRRPFASVPSRLRQRPKALERAP